LLTQPQADLSLWRLVFYLQNNSSKIIRKLSSLIGNSSEFKEPEIANRTIRHRHRSFSELWRSIHVSGRCNSSLKKLSTTAFLFHKKKFTVI